MSADDDVPVEPRDEHIYNSIFIYKETFDFLFKSLCFYRDALNEALTTASLDQDLKTLLSLEDQRASPAHNELNKVNRGIAWWERLRSEAGEDPFDYNIGSFSHGTVRFLKSVACLYLRHLRSKRDAFSKRQRQPKYVLETLDTVLSRFEEKMHGAGVFGAASTIPLLVEDVLDEFESASGNSAAGVPALAPEGPASSPVLLESVQILDPALRDRCLDLFNSFDQTKQHDRFDTVVGEATRILEDRLRRALGLDAGVADDLANKAFGSNRPKLRISDVPSEQNAVLLLFKGLFGHVRNPAHHKLLGQLSPERTIQVLAMVDYALHLIETAQKEP